MVVKRILAVDDNIDFCANIKDILELEGYEVMIAHNGREAIDLAINNHFDLILMDLIMPGMDGVTAIKAIRQKGLNIPILVETAWGEEPVMQSAMDAGANDRVSKPIDFKLFFRLINNHQQR